MALRVKERFKVKVVDNKGGILQDHESSYVDAHLPHPTKIGQPATSSAQRQKEYDKRQERAKKWEEAEAVRTRGTREAARSTPRSHHEHNRSE